MRSLACVVIGVALIAGCKPEAAPSTPTAPVSPPPSSGTTSRVESTPSSENAVRLVSLEVPEMSCPFSCWPKVKETLEGQSGVDSVQLAKQADENAIDNPIVHVQLNGEFNTNLAIQALSKAGFEGSKIVQN